MILGIYFLVSTSCFASDVSATETDLTRDVKFAGKGFNIQRHGCQLAELLKESELLFQLSKSMAETALRDGATNV